MKVWNQRFQKFASFLSASALALVLATSTLGLLHAAPGGNDKGKGKPVATPGTSQQFANTLNRLERELTKLAELSPSDNTHAPTHAFIKQLERDVRGLDRLMERDWSELGSHIQKHKLPAAIKNRLDSAQADYQNNLQGLQTILNAVVTASPEQLPGAIANALDYLRDQGPARPNIDDTSLPLKDHDQPLRAPREAQADYHSALNERYAPVHVASTTMPTGIFASLSALILPTAADLAASEDVVLTPAIQAQATALNNHPINIYNWVRQEIEFVPSFGSIQGSEGTLQSRRGNAFDTASLLIALLRASCVPVRYTFPENVANSLDRARVGK